MVSRFSSTTGSSPALLAYLHAMRPDQPPPRMRTSPSMVIAVSGSSGLDAQERHGGAAEHGELVLVAQAGRAEHVVDCGLGPRIRKVGPDDELLGPRLGGEVAEPFRREDHRVEVELLEVLRRL